MALRVDEWRRLKKISKEEMAQKLGVHRNTITNWETNPSIIPIEKAYKMADIYEVELNDIIFLP